MRSDRFPWRVPVQSDLKVIVLTNRRVLPIRYEDRYQDGTIALYRLHDVRPPAME
jgi:hypothetical protein